MRKIGARSQSCQNDVRGARGATRLTHRNVSRGTKHSGFNPNHVPLSRPSSDNGDLRPPLPFHGVNMQLALRVNYTVNLLICVLLPGMGTREVREVRNSLL
jgi:hypothetical protein